MRSVRARRSKWGPERACACELGRARTVAEEASAGGGGAVACVTWMRRVGRAWGRWDGEEGVVWIGGAVIWIWIWI